MASKPETPRLREIGTSAGTTFYEPHPRAAKKSAEDLEPTRRTLSAIAEAIGNHLAGRPADPIPLNGLDQASRQRIEEILGNGEVDILVSPARAEIREAAAPGVWRVRMRDGSGGPPTDVIEVGAFPDVALRVLERETRGDLEIPEGGEDAINARAILAEIRHHLVGCRPGAESHSINLSSLPVFPLDMAIIDDVLGLGPVEALSRGTATCHVASTRCRHVWRVRCHGSDDRLLADMIDIVHIPEAVAATEEDMRDAADQLADMIRADL